jgi:hypothetical protein
MWILAPLVLPTLAAPRISTSSRGSLIVQLNWSLQSAPWSQLTAENADASKNKLSWKACSGDETDRIRTCTVTKPELLAESCAPYWLPMSTSPSWLGSRLAHTFSNPVTAAAAAAVVVTHMALVALSCTWL